MVAFKTEETLGISTATATRLSTSTGTMVVAFYRVQLSVFCCFTTANCLEFMIAYIAATPTVSETVGRDTVYSFNNSSRAPSCGNQLQPHQLSTVTIEKRNVC